MSDDDYKRLPTGMLKEHMALTSQLSSNMKKFKRADTAAKRNMKEAIRLGFEIERLSKQWELQKVTIAAWLKENKV